LKQQNLEEEAFGGFHDAFTLIRPRETFTEMINQLFVLGLFAGVS